MQTFSELLDNYLTAREEYLHAAVGTREFDDCQEAFLFASKELNKFVGKTK